MLDTFVEPCILELVPVAIATLYPPEEVGYHVTKQVADVGVGVGFRFVHEDLLGGDSSIDVDVTHVAVANEENKFGIRSLITVKLGGVKVSRKSEYFKRIVAQKSILKLQIGQILT